MFFGDVHRILSGFYSLLPWHMEYEYEWDIISNNIPLILPDLMIFKVRNGKEIDRNPLKRDPLGC